MNETLLNWLFASDPAQAAQTRVLLDNQDRETPYDGWMANAHEAFRNEPVATLHAYLCRLKFYRLLALRGKIAG